MDSVINIFANDEKKKKEDDNVWFPNVHNKKECLVPNHTWKGGFFLVDVLELLVHISIIQMVDSINHAYDKLYH